MLGVVVSRWNGNRIRHVPTYGPGSGGPGLFHRKENQNMTFIFTPKLNGKPMGDIQVPFNGTAQEAHTRATNLAGGLVDLLGKGKRFTVRIDRTDRAAKGYEVGPDGHTVD